MSTAVIESVLADVRAQVWAAQATVARAGAVTWTGTAADAAEVRRTELLTALRRCADAVDALDGLVAAARRAEQQCHAPSGLLTSTRPAFAPAVPAWA